MNIQQALELHHAGRFAEAEAAYRQILAAQPGHYHALHFLGVLRAQLGDMAGSVEFVGRSVALKPDDPLSQFHLAEALRQLKRHREAADAYARSAALKPDFAEAYAGGAAALIELKSWTAALDAADRALALKPELFEAVFARGRALQELGRCDEALAVFERAIALRPDAAEAHDNRGNALAGLGRPAEALQSYDKAIALDPRSASAHNNRGNVLISLDRLDDALAAFQAALAADPTAPSTYFNYGSALLVVEKYEAALAAFDSAIALKPDYAEAYFNRAGALHKLDREDESQADLARALTINPDLGLAASHRFMHKAAQCDWHEREVEIAELKRFCAEDRLVDPLVVLAAFDDPPLHLKAARLAAGPAFPPQFSAARVTHQRIRVGYLSPDFREHPVGLQIVEVLEHHDRSRFEIFGFCLHSAPDSPVRSRIKTACGHFIAAEGLSHLALSRLIAGQEIDIVVDLGGYTEKSRTRALAHRPAPVAASYLGYAGSTGAGYIDYIIADGFSIPPTHEAFFSEKIVRLPHCFFPTDTTERDALPVLTRPDAGLPEGVFVFCSFNNSYKITPELFDIWMRLLLAVPESGLWLRMEKPAGRTNLRLEAERRGVDPGRLIFAERFERKAHQARIALADLFLDSTPYNAHTTCNDALWAGLPVLTCAGRSFASRAAGSMLSVLGIDELITRDLKDYEALALELARSPDRLKSLRERIVAARRDHPLFDMVLLCRSLESAYSTMIECHDRGQKPQSFSVNMTA